GLAPIEAQPRSEGAKLSDPPVRAAGSRCRGNRRAVENRNGRGDSSGVDPEPWAGGICQGGIAGGGEESARGRGAEVVPQRGRSGVACGGRMAVAAVGGGSAAGGRECSLGQGQGGAGESPRKYPAGTAAGEGEGQAQVVRHRAGADDGGDSCSG